MYFWYLCFTELSCIFLLWLRRWGGKWFSCYWRALLHWRSNEISISDFRIAYSIFLNDGLVMMRLSASATRFLLYAFILAEKSYSYWRQKLKKFNWNLHLAIWFVPNPIDYSIFHLAWSEPKSMKRSWNSEFITCVDLTLRKIGGWSVRNGLKLNWKSEEGRRNGLCAIAMSYCNIHTTVVGYSVH